MSDLYQEDFERELQIRLQREIERIADNPDAVISAYQKKIHQLEKKFDATIGEYKPKADFYDTVTQSDDWSEMSQVAKLIGITYWGRNKIFAFLRDRGLLRFNNEPYQAYVERGYFKLVEQYFENPQTGETLINKKTVVSQKGIDFIRRLIIEHIEESDGTASSN